MASEATATPAPANKTKSKTLDKWEVSDAMHTMMRAGEIIKDKKLMAAVKDMAKDKAVEMQNVAAQAGQLAKLGRISPKQMAKLGAR